MTRASVKISRGQRDSRSPGYMLNHTTKTRTSALGFLPRRSCCAHLAPATHVGHVGDSSRISRTCPLPALNQSRSSPIPRRCGSVDWANVVHSNTVASAHIATAMRERESRRRRALPLSSADNERVIDPKNGHDSSGFYYASNIRPVPATLLSDPDEGPVERHDQQQDQRGHDRQDAADLQQVLVVEVSIR